jgi:hypothetical protein
MMGETVAHTICGNKREYRPGHWFNSAKFLDIEYQTYGWVFGEKGKSEKELHFHWRHPKEKICLTIAYHKDNRKLLGLNTFGIRLRHEVLDTWLSQNITVDKAMENLGAANFDPEWYTRYEPEIRDAFRNQNTVEI